MTVCTEAADVAVVIAAALGERNDMVGDRSLADDASARAVPAERFGTQTAQTLRNRAAPPQPGLYPLCIIIDRSELTVY
ncbi:hypothetical protein LH20_12130 [Sphingopyxis sp. 113P3]|nr:hypothetical protein LH20_12130 [Sphingopyxis sp. 113P3]